MEAFNLSYPGTFLAGLLSFLSPCVLPLVPPYLCFLAGMTLEDMTGETETKAQSGRVMRAAIAFVLGFSTVFVALGATATTIGGALGAYLDYFAMAAGIVIIILGLHFLGIFRIGYLFREARFHVAAKPAGMVGAYIVGLAFAFGWTPCVGPILAAILLLAGSEDSVQQGALLLFIYSLGIGLPFLAAALAIKPFMAFFTRFRRYLGHVEKAMGGLLVLTGILFLTGNMSVIGFWLLETFPALGTIG